MAKVGTSKAGSTISQLGCGTSVASHGKPIKEEEEEMFRYIRIILREFQSCTSLKLRCFYIIQNSLKIIKLTYLCGC
jgi:hypothetical protein